LAAALPDCEAFRVDIASCSDTIILPVAFFRCCIDDNNLKRRERVADAGEVANQLNSGSVWINKHGDIGPETPFAGAKMSGVEIDMGTHGLLEFTQAKVVSFAKAANV
jgi:hypothetical protein